MARKPIVEEPESGSKTGFQEPESAFEVEASKRAVKKGKPAKKTAKKQEAPRSAKKAEKAAGKKLSKVASAFKSFRPASEVLTVVRAVPTRFVQIDHATGVGGWPIERLTIVHGASGHGKSSFALGLAGSFLDCSHYADFVDAEMTTPPDFARKMIGASFDSDRFFACRPSNLEEVIARVRFFCRGVQKMRESDAKLTGLVVIDSLKKLMPEGTVDAILKAAKGGEDISAGQDRSGQIAAKANTAWMNELTILLAKACVGMVIIGREMENPDAKPHEKKSGWDFKLGGGKAPFFEASIVARVELAGEVKEPGSGSGEYDPSLRVFGERHRVVIYKTKVSAHESKKTVGFFHTSNGVLIPEGFDRARDVIEMAERFEVIDRSGSWYSHRGKKIGNGRDASVVALTKDTEWLGVIEREVRAKFATRAQVVVEHGNPFVENTGEVVA